MSTDTSLVEADHHPLTENNDTVDNTEEAKEIVEHTTECRVLSDEDLKKLQTNAKFIENFKKDKILKETRRNWDIFYKRNETKFFKDRHWTLREFNELDESVCAMDDIKLLEIGCGVGNFVYPLLKINDKLNIYACDFSDRAIDLVKKNENYETFKNRCFPFVCDVTQTDSLEANLNGAQMDIVTLIFVLSAIQPSQMSNAIKNIYKILKPGGIVLVRDYGLYDQAQIRFNQGHRIDDKCYVRCDNTLSYFFELNELENLFKQNNFIVKTNSYVYRETVNFKENLKVTRVFVQSKFIKPTNV